MLPLTYKVPVLSLVKIPLPVIAPLMNMLVPDATPAFNALETKEIAVPVLVIDKVPASTFILAALVKLIVPLKILVPKILRIAPVLLKPVPLMVIPSGTVNAAPLISKAAPVLTVVPTDPEAPRAVLFCICTTPVETVVGPAKVLAVLKINLPVPVPSLVT